MIKTTCFCSSCSAKLQYEYGDIRLMNGYDSSDFFPNVDPKPILIFYIKCTGCGIDLSVTKLIAESIKRKVIEDANGNY